MKVTEFQHLSSREFGWIRKINSYRTLWLHLSKLTQEFGNSNGVTYGTQTLLLFAVSVLVTYGFMVELTERFDKRLFCSGLVFQVIIFLQCNSAHGAANEVRTCLLITTCLFAFEEIIFCRVSIYLIHTI